MFAIDVHSLVDGLVHDIQFAAPGSVDEVILGPRTNVTATSAAAAHGECMHCTLPTDTNDDNHNDNVDTTAIVCCQSRSVVNGEMPRRTAVDELLMMLQAGGIFAVNGWTCY